MAIGGPFRELGGFLDACERGERTVNRVETIDSGNAEADTSLAANVELALEPTETANEELGLCSPRIDADGTLRFALETTRELVPTTEFDVEVDLLDARIDPAGGGTVSMCVRPASDSGEDAAGTAAIRGTEQPSDDGGRGDGVDGDGTPRDVPRRDRRGDVRSPETENGERSTSSKRANPAGGRRAEPTTGVPDDSADEQREVPPFKNPDLLAEVYESCATFAEMADAIEMDVTAETVRRYMIDFDIHQPNSYRTGDSDGSAVDEPSDAAEETDADPRARADAAASVSAADEAAAEDDSTRDDRLDASVSRGHGNANGDDPARASDPEPVEQVVLSDGIGLPEDVTAETLIETVKRSNTIYEVTQDIGLERQDAFEMLHDLNLVDLVMGRLATEAEREITREEIVERLRETSATQ